MGAGGRDALGVHGRGVNPEEEEQSIRGGFSPPLSGQGQGGRFRFSSLRTLRVPGADLFTRLQAGPGGGLHTEGSPGAARQRPQF